jgi:hypothetical protein
VGSLETSHISFYPSTINHHQSAFLSLSLHNIIIIACFIDWATATLIDYYDIV